MTLPCSCTLALNAAVLDSIVSACIFLCQKVSMPSYSFVVVVFFDDPLSGLPASLTCLWTALDPWCRHTTARSARPPHEPCRAPRVSPNWTIARRRGRTFWWFLLTAARFVRWVQTSLMSYGLAFLTGLIATKGPVEENLPQQHRDGIPGPQVLAEDLLQLYCGKGAGQLATEERHHLQQVPSQLKRQVTQLFTPFVQI